MYNRTTSTHPHHGDAYGQAVAAVLFAAILLFAILMSLRYAHGWASVLSEGAAAVPMAADGLVAIVSALITAVGAVSIYAARLAR